MSCTDAYVQKLTLVARLEHCSSVLSSFWLPWIAQTWSIEQRGHHMTCVYWNKPQVSHLQLHEQPSALWTTLKYELVDTNGVRHGIQKVRVEPATRSVVATCTFIQYKCMHVPFLIQVFSKLQVHIIGGGEFKCEMMFVSWAFMNTCYSPPWMSLHWRILSSCRVALLHDKSDI